MKYIFADEAGDLNFTPKSSKYFVVTAVSMSGVEPGLALLNLRHELGYEQHPELWECGFHASEDRQPVRDRVYSALAECDFAIDAIVMDKSKTYDYIKKQDHYFYQLAWHLLFRDVIAHYLNTTEKVLIAAGSLGEKEKKKRFLQSITDVIKQHHDGDIVRAAFWSAASHPCLQVADYCCWALQRWKERNDDRSYVLIKSKIRSCYQPY